MRESGNLRQGSRYPPAPSKGRTWGEQAVRCKLQHSPLLHTLPPSTNNRRQNHEIPPVLSIWGLRPAPTFSKQPPNNATNKKLVPYAKQPSNTENGANISPNITSKPPETFKNHWFVFIHFPFFHKMPNILLIYRQPSYLQNGTPRSPNGAWRSPNRVQRAPKIEPWTHQDHQMPPICLPKGPWTLQDTKNAALKVTFG